ncbi:two-component regulator propeller domain-containing protein [uncultured Psychroserpens sp.]|uniref:type IX secretion system anionic LPS delivery protein PorZ n=1 Tax=uncultured Psychroserpens sp. TaxID=255436 RepID=UPI0026361AB3|nr:two-component regulator propeller domain-containing protein [uncultured Psychroserpens sp.]
MKQILTVLFFLILSLNLCAQDFSDLWQGHFSYLNIVDFSSGEDILYAASENAVFTFDYNTNEITKISTIEGLSGGTISSIHYSDTFDTLIIGYDTGLIDVVLSDNEVLTVIDILNKVTIPPNEKNINHFNEHNGLLYISTDYGISVYDIERLEFGDTYFIGTGGSQINVNQTTVYNGFIYAACSQGNGIRRAELANPNLIDFNQWALVRGGNIISVENVDDNIYAVAFNRQVFEILDNPLSPIATLPLLPVDTRSFGSNLIITTINNVFVYDSEFNLLVTVDNNNALGITFTAATINSEAEIFIGSRGKVGQGKPGRGILNTTFSDVTSFEEIHPNGPLKNNVFSLESSANDLWAVFGGYSRTFSPSGGVRRSGISRYIDEEWRNIVYDSIASAVDSPDFLSDISINPFNTNQVFITSHFSGLLELNNEVPTIMYTEDNSTLTRFNGSVAFVSVSTFDRNGALWVMNSRTERPLNKFENGQWSSFDFTSIIPIPPANSNLGFSSLVIDSRQTKFIGSFSFGLLGFNEGNNGLDLDFSAGEENNFPTLYVTSLAIDNNGQLWIGTDRGLRVLFNPSNFFTNKAVNNIVILEEGIPKELLSNQVITDIEVDGSNNKWVATADAGVFYFTPDGQETIFQFTTDNSPLPSNTINDVSIDPDSGVVFIATTDGLVSFSSGGSKPKDTLDDVFVYPNPVRPEYNILGFDNLNDINNGVKISGITENVNIKITDIEGNLVAEAQSRVNQRTSRANYNFAIDGGLAIWNGKNLANNVVATGVYLILITDLDSLETKVLKLLIVR